MPKRLLMDDLVMRCLRRCDKVGDGNLGQTGTGSEAYGLASETYGEMWTAVAGTGSRYFETKATIAANGAASYLEPQDHLATVGVDFVDANGRRRPLVERMAQERYAATLAVGDAREYVHVDDQLYLFPQPSSGSYEWLYIPQPTDLTNYAPTDVVDVVNPHGLTYMLWGFSVKALAKSEKATDGAIVERDAALERLIEWANKKSGMYSAKHRIVQRDRELDCGLDDF